MSWKIPCGNAIYPVIVLRNVLRCVLPYGHAGDCSAEPIESPKPDSGESASVGWDDFAVIDNLVEEDDPRPASIVEQERAAGKLY